jgi:SAM-dependent methyltransferase
MRLLVPELLDGLPADDPAAQRSRRDLARINGVMRQPAIMAKALSACSPPRLLADLGSGDGRFLLAVAKRMARRWPGVTALICDRQDIVSATTRAAFARLGWQVEVRQGDIFDTLPEADIITANLFLHHFDDTALARLQTAVAGKARAFIACEPRRSAFALLGARMVWALGGNRVTRHDAVASVRAGFTSQELSTLWPQGRWRLMERSAFPFTHVFTAHAS